MLKKLTLKQSIANVLKIKNISSIRVEILPPLWVKNFPLRAFENPFTGIRNRVNLPAGKNLGGGCLFTSQVSPHPCGGGDVKSRTGLGNHYPQGQLRRFINLPLFQEQAMHSFISLKNVLLSKTLLASLLIAALLLPSDLMASDGTLLKEEITALEKLFTGGYMRLGLLGVCGFAAIYGIVKQSGWIFASGILGCVFAYFMKDWIMKTFTLVV